MKKEKVVDDVGGRKVRERKKPVRERESESKSGRVKRQM